MSTAIRIVIIVLSLFLTSSVFAKIDPQIHHLEQQMATVKSNSAKVDLYISMAKRYLTLGNTSKCDEVCKKALKIAEKSKLDRHKADILALQGDSYFKQNKFTKSATTFLTEYNLRHKNKGKFKYENNSNLADEKLLEVTYNLGIAYGKISAPIGGYKKAKKYLEEAQALAKKQRKYKLVDEIALQLYKLAYNNGKYKDAAEYIQQNLKKENAILLHDITDLRDSIIERDCTIVRQDSVIAEVTQKNVELDTMTQQQGRQIVDLTKEQIYAQFTAAQRSNEMLKQEKEQQKWMLILTFVILLTIIGLIVMYIRYREKKKLNRLLEGRNKIIIDQNQQISSNLKTINEKNRDITDSLNYAGKIQKSLLKNFTNYSDLLSGYFILYRPKDIVSGDFYWGHRVDDKFVFTVGDCTGHSVPGAFMSMLGISLLNQIVGQQHVLKASAILERMRQSVKLNLGQSGDNEEEAKDGMDMAMCVWDMKNNTVNFSGAYNPMFMVRKGELSVYNAEKCPVGIHTKEVAFTDQFIDVAKGDRIYLFSDGYSDQFGGPRFEKFKVARFKKLLAETSWLPIQMQYDKLETAFLDWKQDNVQIDDVCVLGLEI